MIQVYGICGKKFSGKDTFANYITEENSQFKILRFADDLKDMSAKIFSLDRAAMDHPDKKEEKIPAISMDLFLKEMREVTGLDVKPREKVGNSLREILQYFGSEYVRLSDDLYWVNRVRAKIKDLGGYAIVTDVRFLNEESMIKDLGGNIIKIHRMDLPQAKDTHISEMEMEKIKPDLVLGTRTGKFDLQKRVARFIAQGYTEAIKHYDYRRYQFMADYYS